LKISRTLRAIALLLFLPICSVRAFNTLDSQWPKEANVVMHLGLGPTNLALQDGFASWNASAADAVKVWDGYLDFITFSSVSEPSVPQACGDGINSVFFSNTIFGDSFDESTIAITVIDVSDDPKVTAEADVVVNTAFRYDSYRGPLQSNVIDFHRVILHEFGHVLGLAHIDLIPPGQVLMEPYISDVDHPALDDVGGVRFLYGAEFEKGTNFFPGPGGDVRVGDVFDWPALAANNSPTSYSIIGLAPGLTMDTTTGAISGKVTTPGKYDAVITAHGPIADAYGAFSISVVGLNEVQGLLSIIRDIDAGDLVGDPHRPYIYTASNTGIERINTDTGIVTLVSAGKYLPDVLSLSADGSLLYFREYVEQTLHRLDLDTLTELPTLTIPSGYSQVLEGMDGRGYVTGLDGVYQLDLMTGAVESTFGPAPYPQIEITPDRKTLIVTQTGESISTYDISTAPPELLATQDGQFGGIFPSPDSAHIYCGTTGGTGGPNVEFPLPQLTPGRFFGTSGIPQTISVGPDGSIYQAIQSYPDSVVIYGPVSLKVLHKLEISHRPFTDWDVSTVLFDSDPDNFFLLTVSYGQSELWKISTDFSSFPPPDPIPTQDLANISTRARTAAGSEMIGGFIIQGDVPKEVVVRGIGPALPLSGAIGDPILDLYDQTGTRIATNDSWTTSRIAILASQLAPSSPCEAAIKVTLDPGAYTAVVHDAKGQAGSALVEVYDLAPSESVLANISTRGMVGTGDDVMIGGFIIGGPDPTQVLIRAIGPSLSDNGVAGALDDPVLELHGEDGTLLQSNDNWRSTEETEITATGLAPKNDKESAMLATLDGYRSYTAVVRGQGGTTGTALVEVYNLSHPSADKK
jgi:hypothetical protein